MSHETRTPNLRQPRYAPQRNSWTMRSLREASPAIAPEERLVLAILAANLRQQQRIRGKKSKSADKRKAEHRRDRVNLLLRYVIAQKYRDDPQQPPNRHEDC